MIAAIRFLPLEVGRILLHTPECVAMAAVVFNIKHFALVMLDFAVYGYGATTHSLSAMIVMSPMPAAMASASLMDCTNEQSSSSSGMTLAHAM